MTSPGGQEVGRVSIRVVPDTSRFRRQLQAELESIDDTFEIKVELDTTGLRQKLQAAAREASAGVNAEIGVDINKSTTETVKKFAEDISNQVSHVTSDVDVSDSLTKTATEVQNSLGQAEGSSARINTQLSAGARAMRGLTRSIKVSVKNADDLRVNTEKVSKAATASTSKFKEMDGAIGHAVMDRADLFHRLREATQFEFTPGHFGKEDFLNELGPVEKAMRRIQDSWGAAGDLVRDIHFETKNAGLDLKDWAAAIRESRREAKALKKDFQAIQKEAQSGVDPLQLIADNAVRVKIDADITVLQNKIREANKELDDLQLHGHDIVIDGEIQPLLNQIRKATAELDKLEAKRWTPEVEIKIDDKRAQIAALEAELQRVGSKDYTAEVKVRVDNARAQLAALQLQLARLEITKTKHEVEVEVDKNTFQNGIRGVLSKTGTFLAQGLSGLLAGAFKAVGNILPQFMGGALESAGNALQGVGKTGASAMASVTAGIAAAVAAAGLFVFVLGLVSIALAAVGAAVTAVFGLAATALAILPGLLVGLGVAAGVAFLGMDGLKKAAKTIQPVLDDLKKKVSTVFEKGFTPLFKQVGDALKKWSPDIVDVADSFVLLGKTITDALTKGSGFNNVTAILNNMERAVKNLRPGIDNIIDGVLTLGAQKSIWSLLTVTVNEFGRDFNNSVNKTIGDGTFDRAVKGLTTVLTALSRAISGLFENGLGVLAGAGPGIGKFIDSLTNFFGRFNWEKLGKAVGTVFEGLGQALDNVDDQTIKDIEGAFVHLGDVFKDPKFQEGITKFVEALPALIYLIAFFAKKAGEWLGPISDFLKVIQDLLKAWEILTTLLDRWFGGGGGVSAGSLGDGFKNPFEGWDLPDWITNGFKIPGLGDDNAIDIKVTFNGGDELSLDGPINTMMQKAAEAVTAGFTNIATVTIPAGMLALATAITNDIQVDVAWLNMSAEWGAAVSTALVDISLNAVPIGMALIGQAILDGLNLITPQWQLAGLVWQTVILGAMNTIGLTVNNGLIQMQITVANGMAAITTVFQTGWGAVAASTVVGMAAVTGTVNGEMPKVTDSVRRTADGMTLSWQAGWNTMIRITTTGVEGVASLVSTMPSRIIGSIPSPLTILYEIGRAIMTGLLNGIKAAANAVYEYVSGIAGRIASLKGPLPYDRRLLIPAGLAIMEGLNKGLQDGFGAVQRTVVRMAPQIADAFQSTDLSNLADLPDSFVASQYVSGDIASTVSSDGFGIDKDEIAQGIISGLTGSTLKVDGHGLAKIVNNDNNRKGRRG